MNALGPMPPEYDTVTEAGLGRFIMYADIVWKLKVGSAKLTNVCLPAHALARAQAP